MKLLGWMHRKLRQNSLEPLKHFAAGNSSPCLSAQSSSSYQNNNSAQSANCRKEEVLEEESSDDYLFHGFLAIGTLGSELPDHQEETPTPTFPVASGSNAAQDHQEAGTLTVNQLKYIKDELEKFLEVEDEEATTAAHHESSSSESRRSSHVSIITLLSGEQQTDEEDVLVDAEETYNYKGATERPLQNYLFSAPVELSETDSEKIRRDKFSLGKLLFRKNAHKHPAEKSRDEGEEKKSKGGRHATRFIKKMLRKTHTTAAIPAGDTSTGKKTHSKVLRMFRQKVHPEEPMADKYVAMLPNDQISEKAIDKQRTVQGKEIKALPRNATLKKEITCSAGNEHWIKTDPEYLVLEL